MAFFEERLLKNIEHHCEGVILDALNNKDVIEIMLNPDGNVWIEKYGSNQEHVGKLPIEQGKQILSLVAHALKIEVKAETPIVEGSFPLDGSRFEGVYPPVVSPGASFTIRKKASRIMSLQEYLENGIITQEVIEIIRKGIQDYKNIFVVGGTSSGKTTFVNAIINELYNICPNDRLLILEDTAELQAKNPNKVFMLTSDLANIGMRKLTTICMRFAPKRIIVGEVRDSAALEMFKIANTGHPGTIGTFHANSAIDAIERIEELIEEANQGSKQKLIGRTLDLIIYMRKNSENSREVHSIIEVKKFDAKTQEYITKEIYKK